MADTQEELMVFLCHRVPQDMEACKDYSKIAQKILLVKALLKWFMHKPQRLHILLKNSLTKIQLEAIFLNLKMEKCTFLTFFLDKTM